MKKILPVFLVISLLFVSVSADFHDTENHWAESSIERWSSLGVINGYEGYFRPDDTITRGEMAVILDRIIKYQTTTENTFTDLDNNFYYDAILKVNAAGVMLGYNNLVRPNDCITREEAGAMICRAFEITDSSNSGVYTAETVSDWALTSMNSLSSLSYLNNIDGFKEHKGNITRAETVALLDNIICELIFEGGEYSGEYKGNVVINTSNVSLKNATVNGNVIITEGANGGNVTFTQVTLNGKVIKQCDSDVFKITNPETDLPKATATPVPTATPAPTAAPEIAEELVDDGESIEEPVTSQVTVSLNADIIGAGELASREVVEIEEGMTVADVLTTVLDNNGYTYEYTGSLDENFYISAVSGIPAFTPSISEETAAILAENGIDFVAEDYVEGTLGEFSFTMSSGWLYKLNGEFGDISMTDQTVTDGDEVELCFTLVYGYDLGSEFNPFE